ncbi:hypothetical protein SERLA73DRAFT_178167 [Serpula lacrymans var. lacrymans S7.3]|uniref:Alpha-ketoglutarate-dependent dioxygenase AlkB-like domain-containing protein n=1 Tax=Serpula lacrymans var. lacrymans (strain S7.3) TaxID=936435 RepID=F8PQV4_SERL3|nr:hypothetical protein SERLA73DRAFT_178167 [Serpula lacrymans var. lacrymans S7.3]
MQQALRLYFRDTNVNQVMLFGRVNSQSDNGEVQTSSGLPAFLISLISTLEELLRPVLPPPTHTLLFPPKTAPPRARQAILNLYNPGEGISSHVDLLNRFGDGIIGISMGSGCVMNFEKHSEHKDMDDVGKERWELFLPERSIIVMTEDARYSWKHGIEGRQEDLVESEEGTDSGYCLGQI